MSLLDVDVVEELVDGGASWSRGGVSCWCCCTDIGVGMGVLEDEDADDEEEEEDGHD